MQEAGVSTDGHAEVWWSGGCSASRKLESAQMGVGRRLLGESNMVAGVVM